jgi:methionyl aminopeptidase
MTAPVRPGRVSPRRAVPDHIRRPPYADTGDPGPVVAGSVRTGDELSRMRAAGAAAATVLERVGRAVAPGTTGDELDVIGHEETIRLGAYPSTLGYRGYPKSLCTSVNEVICHGIPDDRPLAEGDIVNVDVTVYLDGVHGDTSATFYVGEVDAESHRLVEATRLATRLGIEAVRPGRPVNDIGRAIEALARSEGLGVVRAFIGHGIGPQFHTGLQIPHHFDPAATTEMVPGMTFTVEPMLTAGTWQHRLWDDGWTAVTADGKRSAQFEHTLVVTEDGAEILTVDAEGRCASGITIGARVG